MKDNLEKYLDYLDDGKKLYRLIADKLNLISDEYVRWNKDWYRREVDFKELCVALGILADVFWV